MVEMQLPPNLELDRPAARTVQRQKIMRYARLISGWALLLVGLAGFVLPIIPGIPLTVIGVALIGRRSRPLRWLAVNWKLAVKRWSMQPHPLLNRTGRWAWTAQKEVSRQLRRLRWWHLERARSQ